MASSLSTQQLELISGIVEGKTRYQSALDAGYAESTAKNVNRAFNKNPAMLVELNRQKDELAQQGLLTRTQRLAMLDEAAIEAKDKGELRTMQQLINESNKMCGHHSPIIQKVETNTRDVEISAEDALEKLKRLQGKG
ncbi:hypothetical protein MK852_23815 [Shewanella benthica]|uniref:hypothetical protein n=1 Tax=Shewanella benthica TaxID=43661 RepID=UPI00187AACD4|nr:hypothetical protein [Shewanella benthica]MBE7216376.1 hypothetical protein [Shewanella benthica]MCL1065122.1 hypothetical protein [Shewanella benthica]